MPEKHKLDFYNLYRKKISKSYDFFMERTELINHKDFKYLVCNIDIEIMKCAVKIAKEKSQFTMAQNQASIPRSEVVKLNKCAQGVLAEMFVHFLLMNRYKLDVLRYDLERPTFVYSTEEYDLKIITSDGLEYEVESRSSNIHHSYIQRFISTDVFIGPYGNKLKITDDLADFHFRPIYMPNFEPFIEEHGKTIYNPAVFNGDVLLVITGVATKQDFIKNAYDATLGQKGTIYLVVNASIVGDIVEMDSKFKDFFNQR